MLAIEAIFTVMPRMSPVNFEAVSALIKEITTTSSDNGKGNPKVEVIAEGILFDAGG